MAPKRRNIDPTLARHRARIAALTRDRQPNDPDLMGARRDMAGRSIELAVEKALAAAPPLTADQLARITSLLASSGQAMLQPIPAAGQVA